MSQTSAPELVTPGLPVQLIPGISIVVPTRNEAGNVDELVRRISALPLETPPEIIFVDDSTDNTPDVVRKVAAAMPLAITVHHRKLDEREGGLGGAVKLGISLARADWVCVMDGDLQHPPELVPQMLNEATQSSSDLVVASRYCSSGDFGEFGHLRKVVSEGSTGIARLAFPKAMRNVTDPMSGFFLLRRSLVDPESLKPRGFKILMEILCRFPQLRVSEVPFTFGERHAGESKASVVEGYRYLRQVLDLRFGSAWVSFAKFGLVGLSGILVNAVALAFFTEAIGLYYLLSAVVATQFSTLWNFGLTEAFVFDRPVSSVGRARRAVLFFAMNNAALGLRGPMLFLLVGAIGLNYLIANLFTLVALMAIRYSAADRIIWGRAKPIPAHEMSETPEMVPALGDQSLSPS